MKINYITNQSLNRTSGGWSGINYNIHEQLTKSYELNYIGPISPPSIKSEKLYSKVLRSLGLRGKFHFFSDRRLQIIQKQISEQLTPADYNFYFGQTPWIKNDNSIPYGVYMDADFLTYLRIYSNPNKFIKKDVFRIAKIEESWLQNANHIFIGSAWAWNEMIKNYDIDEGKKQVVYTGGNIPIPEKDNYAGGLNFLFISLNFEKKGGPICVETFKRIRELFPNARLDIIGEKPPEKYMNIDGVNYLGYLNKKEPNDLKVFQEVLSKAFFLIHPTTMDTMGAVLIEAGYYGCPSIAPKSFGIPELILNNKTGIIIDTPFTSDDFSKAILLLIENREKYHLLRKEVWKHTRTNLTWEAIGKKLTLKISKNEHCNF